MIFDTAVLTDKAEMIAVTGGFRNGDGSENVTGTGFLGTEPTFREFRRRQKKFFVCLVPQETSREGISRRSRAVTAEKRTDKRYPRTEMSFCLLNQLLFVVIVAVEAVVAKAP